MMVGGGDDIGDLRYADLVMIGIRKEVKEGGRIFLATKSKHMKIGSLRTH